MVSRDRAELSGCAPSDAIRDTNPSPHPDYLYHPRSACNPSPHIHYTPQPCSLFAMLSPTEETIADIKSATAGFDLIFSNELGKAENLFGNGDSAIHLLGSAACAFLQAALSLEVRTRLHDTLLRPYNAPPDWSHSRSLNSPGTGRSRREEAAQELKEPQADQSLSRCNRMGAYLFGLYHPSRVELCSEVCRLCLSCLLSAIQGGHPPCNPRPSVI